MPVRLFLDIQKINHLYKDGHSAREIGKQLNISHRTVLNRLKESNIERRNNGPSPMIREEIAEKTYKNPEWLYYQYRILGKSQKQIALMCKLAPPNIFYWMRRHNILARTFNDRVRHFRLDSKTRAFLDGLLLGDGCISNATSVSANYTHTEKHKDYLIWLSQQLAGCGIEQVGTIREYTNTFNGHTAQVSRFATHPYSEFLYMRNRWYPDGKKMVPADLIIKPITAFNWYVGDGYLLKRRNQRSTIIFCTECFPENDCLFLIRKLAIKGIKAQLARYRNGFRITLGVDNTIKLLDFIGPCPEEIFPCYGYKWDLTRTKKEWEEDFAYI